MGPPLTMEPTLPRRASEARGNSPHLTIVFAQEMIDEIREAAYRDGISAGEFVRRAVRAVLAPPQAKLLGPGETHAKPPKPPDHGPGFTSESTT